MSNFEVKVSQRYFIWPVLCFCRVPYRWLKQSSGTEFQSCGNYCYAGFSVCGKLFKQQPHCCQVMWSKVGKIIQKGPLKIWPRDFDDQILVLSGRKRTGKHFLTVFSFFQGQFLNKIILWGYLACLDIKYFLLKPLKNTNMPLQNFFCVKQNFFL